MRQVCNNPETLWKTYTKVVQDLGEVWEKPQLVTVEDYKPPRSLSQNARLHCMIRALANHTGHNEVELKDWFKSMYGPTKRLQVGSEGRVIPLSTTMYTRKQMAEMIDHVDRVCAENGVYVEEV